MLDWRAVAGTSISNGVLGLMLASLAVPGGFMICYDCGRGLIMIDPIAPPTFALRPHVIVLPVEAEVQPVVLSDAPYRPDVRGPCPGQPAVDQLPTLIDTSQPSTLDPQAFTACIRVDASGKVDRIVFTDREVVGADQALRHQLTSLRFAPASRDGSPVASWIMLESER